MSETTARQLLAILPLINRILVADLRQEAGDNTTMPQFRVLAYLMEQPLTLSEIARIRRVTLQSAGELVQALVDRGWITRVADPRDRRQTLLHLTELGRQQHERVSSRMIAHMTPIMERLTPEERATVQAALVALQRVLAEEQPTEVETNEHG
ncbi:MAG: MarR family transcriptional regulator [Anaerolineae bacterium]